MTNVRFKIHNFIEGGEIKTTKYLRIIIIVGIALAHGQCLADFPFVVINDSLPGGSYHDLIRIYDADADGRKEIALYNDEANAGEIYEWNGTDSLILVKSYPDHFPETICDLDKDGRMEFAGPSHDAEESIIVWEADAPGEFPNLSNIIYNSGKIPQFSSVRGWLETSDMDKDGLSELTLKVNYSPPRFAEVWIYEWTESESLENKEKIITNGYEITDSAHCDFDKDGITELIFFMTGTLCVYKPVLDDQYRNEFIYTYVFDRHTGEFHDDFRVGDLDSDGKTDIVFTGYINDIGGVVVIMENDRDNHFKIAFEKMLFLDGGSGSGSCAVGDVTGDGIVDITINIGGRLWVYQNTDRDNDYVEIHRLDEPLPWNYSFTINVADINGNGFDEIILQGMDEDNTRILEHEDAPGAESFPSLNSVITKTLRNRGSGGKTADVPGNLPWNFSKVPVKEEE